MCSAACPRPVGACTAREARSAGSRCGEAPCVLRAPGMLLDWTRVGAEQISGCHGACVERSGCFCMGVACCTLPWMVQMWRRIGHLQHCSRASASCTTEPRRRDGWLRLDGEWQRYRGRWGSPATPIMPLWPSGARSRRRPGLVRWSPFSPSLI